MPGRKLKILMTTDTLGGVWNYSMSLCKALSEIYKVEVHLASLGAIPSTAQKAKAGRIKNLHLYPKKYKLEWMQNPWEEVEKARDWVLELYHKISPDLVHLNNYMQLNITSVPVISVFHSCVLTWWRAVKGQDAPEEWKTYAQHVQRALEQSNLVISPNRALLKEAGNYYRFNNYEVIPNACENIKISQEKEKFILCAGRIWDEAKNLGVLSEIAGKLPWPVYIAGSNIDPVSGKEIRIKNVYFLGKLSQKELLEWMARAAIFLSPVKYEPFGLAILEAAKSGCVLAISQLETLKETWGNGAAYFDTEDPRAIEKALRELIYDQDYCQKLIQGSREKAASLNPEKMGKDYYNLYQKILKNQAVIKI